MGLLCSSLSCGLETWALSSSSSPLEPRGLFLLDPTVRHRMPPRTPHQWQEIAQSNRLPLPLSIFKAGPPPPAISVLKLQAKPLPFVCLVRVFHVHPIYPGEWREERRKISWKLWQMGVCALVSGTRGEERGLSTCGRSDGWKGRRRTKMREDDE